MPLLNIEDGGNEVEIDHHIDMPANHNRDAETSDKDLLTDFKLISFVDFTLQNISNQISIFLF